VATWLLSPLAWLLLAAVLLALAGWQRRHRTWTLAAGIPLALVALAAMTPFGANMLLGPLERPRPMPAACSGSTPVAVVLGGGLDGWPRHEADFRALNLSSRRRMDRAVAWWRDGRGRTLVLQGGAVHPRAVPIARLMAGYAQSQGVPMSAIRIEAESGDTLENARHAARLSPPLPERLVLVTSLAHMPRARAAFVDAGFQVCPEGTDSRRLPSRLPWALFPRTSALASAELAIHEWVGLAYYRLRPRTEPSPTTPSE
jgi:uncharacterized SAM-binding protein YcdF (DUF218 family)